jgi:competence ComEA-like helix-hairpin-helix protein
MKKASVFLLLVLFMAGQWGLAGIAQEKIDLNKADERSLETLPGIGPALAKRIIDHRKESGPFRRIEDLMNVRGIGIKKFEALEKHLTVSSPAKPPGEASKEAGAKPPR